MTLNMRWYGDDEIWNVYILCVVFTLYWRDKRTNINSAYNFPELQKPVGLRVTPKKKCLACADNYKPLQN